MINGVSLFSNVGIGELMLESEGSRTEAERSEASGCI